MIFKTIIKNNRKTVIFYLTLGIVLSFLQALGVNFFRRILDGLADRSLSTDTIVIYGFITITVCVMWYLYNIPDSKLENVIYLDLKMLALKKMKSINYTDYQNIGIGKLIQQIETGATAGKNILFGFYFCLIRELLPDVIISLIFIAMINLKLTLYVFIGYIAVFIITNVVLKYLYKIKGHILINEEMMNSHLVRGLMELVVFRTNKRFESEIKKTQQAADIIVSSKTKMLMIHELFFTMFALLVIVLKITIIIYGLVSQSITVGETVALTTFLDKAYNPIAIFNVLYVQYKLDKVAFKRYTDILHLPDDKMLDRGKRVDISRGRIVFANVCFSYGEKSVLDNLSFTVEPNTSVAFVGESGAGKSTVIKQIIGLIKPQSGKITIDGYDLSEIELNHYYDYISYTSQDSPVFNGTLRENIVFDNRDSDDEIIEALKSVNLDMFYNGLEKGLSTEIGEKGVLISGGERQRLALARIFFQKAKIIVLDEATSSMDNLTEERVMHNVMEEFRNETLIIIAHRLSSIRNADNIFVLREGRIIEQGAFDKLINDNGYFKELWDKEIK